MNLLRKSLTVRQRDELLYRHAQLALFRRRLRLYRKIAFSRDTVDNIRRLFAGSRRAPDKSANFHRRIPYIITDTPIIKRSHWGKRNLFTAPPPPVYGRPSIWRKRQRDPKWAREFGILELKNVWCTMDGRVFDAQGRSVVAAWNGRPILRKHRIRLQLQGVDTRLLSEGKDSAASFDEVLVLAQSTDSMYGHFFGEVIPRLALAEDHCRSELPVYANSNLQSYRDIYREFGIDSDRLVSKSEHPVIFARKAIVPIYHFSFRSEYPEFAVRAWKRLRHDLASRCASSPEIPFALISRRNAARSRGRTDAAFDELKRFGFEEIAPEDYDIATQARMFSGTKVMVSCHGSGSFSGGFMSPGSTVLDIFGGATNDIMYRLCRALDIRYLVAQNNTGYPVEFSVSRVFDVDPEPVLRAIRENIGDFTH